jgi:hypothetical protein
VQRLREWLPHRVGPAVGPLATVLVLALMAAIGSPVWSTASTGAAMRAPFHWQRPPPSVTAADDLLRVMPPGSRLLAPDSLSITLAVSTSAVTSVAPREYYLQYLQHDPAFRYADRLALWGFVNDADAAPPRDLPGALRRVGVDVVCTFAADTQRYDAVRGVGYHPLLATADYRCLRRNGNTPASPLPAR